MNATPRIAPVTADNTPAASAPLLAAVKAKLGLTPNMMATMAHAPAVLRGYLSLAEALGGGRLGGATGEAIALAVGEANHCEYCVSAHAVLGKGAGLSEADVSAARRAEASDARRNALLRFARAVVQQRGEVDDAALATARAAGLADADLLEAVAHVALNILTNYVNHVARTEVDFPRLA